MVLSCRTGIDSSQRQTKVSKFGSVKVRSNSSDFFPLKQSVYDLQQSTRFSLQIKKKKNNTIYFPFKTLALN
jgi:hypothetical protein